MQEFREILVLCFGRSGSNLLSSLLEKVEGNAGFYEIFFERRVQGLQGYPRILNAIGASLGTKDVTADDPALLAARDADPPGFFDALSRAARAEGYRSLTCKIFPRQIKTEHLEQLLRRPGARVIFLTRSRIDRYISDLKALQSGQYVTVDTTGLRLQLDVGQFLSLAARQDRELERIQRAVRKSGVPHARLDYGRDLDVGETRRVRNVARVLRAIGLEPDFASTRPESWAVKQDRSEDWRDKIANGPEVAADLARRGRLDYAEASPLADAEGPTVAAHWPGGARKEALLELTGRQVLLNRDPVITVTAIRDGRSRLADWMAGPDPAFASGRGLHFLMEAGEEVDDGQLARSLRLAEVCNPGHRFVVVQDARNAEPELRAAGVLALSVWSELFVDDTQVPGVVDPHPGLPATDVLCVAAMDGRSNHQPALDLCDPLFVYDNPLEPPEIACFARLRGLFPRAHFVNHLLGGGSYAPLGPEDLARVMARARVALVLADGSLARRAAVRCLLAGLPLVTVAPGYGDAPNFPPEAVQTAAPEPAAVVAAVRELLARKLPRHEVRQAALERLARSRLRFLAVANRVAVAHLGPDAPRIGLDPFLDGRAHEAPLCRMVEGLG